MSIDLCQFTASLSLLVNNYITMIFPNTFSDTVNLVALFDLNGCSPVNLRLLGSWITIDLQACLQMSLSAFKEQFLCVIPAIIIIIIII